MVHRHSRPSIGSPMTLVQNLFPLSSISSIEATRPTYRQVE